MRSTLQYKYIKKRMVFKERSSFDSNSNGEFPVLSIALFTLLNSTAPAPPPPLLAAYIITFFPNFHSAHSAPASNS
jgi:hypothetical protein